MKGSEVPGSAPGVHEPEVGCPEAELTSGNHGETVERSESPFPCWRTLQQTGLPEVMKIWSLGAGEQELSRRHQVRIHLSPEAHPSSRLSPRDPVLLED